jgi:hypothetical protein
MIEIKTPGLATPVEMLQREQPPAAATHATTAGESDGTGAWAPLFRTGHHETVAARTPPAACLPAECVANAIARLGARDAMMLLPALRATPKSKVA